LPEHGEPSLAVSKEDSPKLEVGASTMVAIIRHPVIAIRYKDCIIV